MLSKPFRPAGQTAGSTRSAFRSEGYRPSNLRRHPGGSPGHPVSIFTARTFDSTEADGTFRRFPASYGEKEVPNSGSVPGSRNAGGRMRVQTTYEPIVLPISVMIVDGDPRSRRVMEERLREDRDFRVLGVFEDRASGVAAVQDHHPRVAFAGLGKDDGEDLKPLAGKVGRALVLVGATDRDARRAFDLGAKDFLRRPLDGRRVHATLDRLRALRRTPRRWLPVRDPDGPFFVRPDSLECVENGGRRTLLHGEFGSLESTVPLADLAPRLTEAGLVRVSAAALVRPAAVREVRRNTAETWEVRLRSGVVVTSDRGHLSRVETLIAKLRGRS